MNIVKVKQEQVVFLRNNDVFTISQRGVTTGEDTGTFSSDSSHLINVSDGKNIRSITVGGSPLALGTDYTVDYNFDDSGTTKIKFTFVSAQTGAYVISYDYGTDKIYPDFPRDDLNISSFPRLAVDILNAPIEPFGIGGGIFISNVALTIVVYDDNSDDLDSYIQTIKDLYVANSKNFFYLNFVKPTLIGPTINDPDKKDEIMQKNIDILGMFNVEGS